ncbi:hypothetical protein VTJ04DRAFT_5907 [Mycothermus thermophilus]|uniref:uncharacterized protein n=1 Tax=Humicola insolens TaxID=85995 RepID=UPI003742244F
MYMALPLISLHHPGTTAGIESRGGQEKNKSLIPPTKSSVIPRAAIVRVASQSNSKTGGKFIVKQNRPPSTRGQAGPDEGNQE